MDGADNFSSASVWALASGTVYRAASVNWDPVLVYVDDVRLNPSTASPAALPVNSFVYVSGGNGGLFVNLGGASPSSRVTRVGRRTYGFKVSGRSYVTIQGFGVTRTQDRGIYLYSNSANCVVRGNTVTNTYKTGISVNAVTNVLIEQNKCSLNQDHGIGLTAASTGCTVQDNESFQNANPIARQANGIYLNRSTGNLIRRNRLHHNQDSGLQYSTSSDGNIAIQNLSWSNGDHGMDCLNSANSVTIGCVSYANYKDGFSIEGTSPGGSLYDCIAVNNGVNVARSTGHSDSACGSMPTPRWDSSPTTTCSGTHQPASHQVDQHVLDDLGVLGGLGPGRTRSGRSPLQMR